MFSETAELTIKRRESADMSRQVAAFLESGREITPVPIGTSGDTWLSAKQAIQAQHRARAIKASIAARNAAYKP